MVRAPVQPVEHHAHTQVGDSTLVLQPFERTFVKAKMVTANLEPLVFQNVVLNAVVADASLQNVVFLEDCVTTVTETGHVFISVTDLTSNPQRVRGQTRLGTVVPVSLVNRAVPQQVDGPKPKTEVDKDHIDFVHQVYEKINIITESHLTSSSEFEFFVVNRSYSGRPFRP